MMIKRINRLNYFFLFLVLIKNKCLSSNSASVYNSKTGINNSVSIKENKKLHNKTISESQFDNYKKRETLISNLRNKGKFFVSNKMYSEASGCYTALLQLHEGLPGKNMDSLRRRFALTLAQCHIKLGNTEEAIARFSDVIDESPVFIDENENPDNDIEMLKISVGLAFLNRGMAFKSLGLNEFSYVDLNFAIEHSPFDNRPYEALEEIVQLIDIDLEDENGENIKIEQQIFVENLQENFPKQYLNSQQINKILRKESKNTFTKRNQLPNSIPNLNGFGGLFGGGLSNIESIIPMIGSLTGLNQDSISNLKEIWSALKTVFLTLKSIYDVVIKRSSTIVIAAAFLLSILLVGL